MLMRVQRHVLFQGSTLSQLPYLCATAEEMRLNRQNARYRPDSSWIACSMYKPHCCACSMTALCLMFAVASQQFKADILCTAVFFSPMRHRLHNSVHDQL